MQPPEHPPPDSGQERSQEGLPQPEPPQGYQPPSGGFVPPTATGYGPAGPLYGSPYANPAGYSGAPYRGAPESGAPTPYSGVPEYGGYGAPGYAGGPAYPGMPGYDAPGYGAPGYGYPIPPGAGRPGTVVAAAVLAYVVAGLLILAGLFLFYGATVISSLAASIGSNGSGVAAEAVLDGVVNFVAAGLLIAGGVMTTVRRGNGRALLTVGAAVCLAAGVYWTIRVHDAGVLPWLVLFAAPTVVALFLLWQQRVSAWLAGYR